MYNNFAPILIFIIAGLILAGVPFLLQSILSPKFNKGGEKLRSYECGEVPEGSAWIKFNIRFYIIALVFIIFDVEVIFLYPWAVAFQDLGLLAFVEMMIFIFVLVAGFAYVWLKGDLDWVKLNLKYGQGRYSQLKSENNSVHNR